MKILLLKGPLVRSSFAPLGLCYIGAVLEKAGHGVKIVDMANENLSLNNLRNVLFSYKPDVVGIGAMSIEFEDVIEIASFCKKNLPNTKIILGGPVSVCVHDSLASELLEPYVDAIVIGEGEETVIELIDRIGSDGSLKNVKGIAYWCEGVLRINPRREIVDLDTLPFPARHLLNMERYISPFENWFGDPSTRAVNMIGSRGCPYACIYCDKNVFGQKWRGRSPSNIVNEIQLLVEKYRVNGIIFNDDEFDLDRKWVSRVCDEMARRGLDVVWGCNSRCNHADREIYQKMYKSGCVFVAFGIEFGNQKMLDFTRKGFTVKRIIDAIKIAKQAGLRVIGYFMIGMLGENKQTIKDTMSLAIKLKLNSGAFGIASPIIGTDLYEMALKEGVINNRQWWRFDRGGGKAVNLTQELALKQLEVLRRQANWEIFWNSPDRRLKLISRALLKLSLLVARIDLDRIVLCVEKMRKTFRIPLP